MRVGGEHSRTSLASERGSAPVALEDRVADDVGGIGDDVDGIGKLVDAGLDQGGGDHREPPGRIPASQAAGLFWLVVPACALVGFVVAVLAAFDVRILGSWTVVIAGGGFVLLTAAAAGATVTAFIVEWRPRSKGWTPFDPSTGVWFLLTGILLTAFTLWGSWWLLVDAELDGRIKAVVAIAIVVSARFGAGLTLAATCPFVLSRKSTVVALNVVRALVGIALGVFLAIGPVILVGFVRTWKSNVSLPAPPPITMPVDHYVALGDSYSAGEGLEHYDPGTQNVADGGDRCHRSRYAYSQQLQFSGGPPDSVFVACSGAVTSELFGAGHGHVPPQVDPNSRPDTDVDLVTLTMGGNDVGFSNVVSRCLEVDDCTKQLFDPGNDHPTTTMEEWAKAKADVLAADLGVAYELLRTHYPSARIVVLGYPYLFPGGDPGVRFSDCDTILRRVSTTEREQLRILQDQLTARLYREAVAADVEFVSPQAVWDGHEPCGERGQYTNAINPLVFDGSFHPNRAGQRAYATLLACYLDTTVQPAPGQLVHLPWETDVAATAPAPGSLARPVPCPEPTTDS